MHDCLDVLARGGSRPQNPCRALKSGLACAISPGNPLPSPGAAHRRRQPRLNRAPAVSGPRAPRIPFSGNRMTPLDPLTVRKSRAAGIHNPVSQSIGSLIMLITHRPNRHTFAFLP